MVAEERKNNILGILVSLVDNIETAAGMVVGVLTAKDEIVVRKKVRPMPMPSRTHLQH